MLSGYLISPLTYALLLALALVLFWARLPHMLRYLGVFVEVVLLMSIAPLGANALIGAIESQTPPPSACVAPEPTTIVVLSGGTRRSPRSIDDFAALNEPSLERLFAGVALWRRTPGARLMMAGGGRPVAQSELMANLAERMGVPVSAVAIESRSRTTWENARNLAALAPPLPRRIWLVSSALHLPRALRAFRAYGFDPCAWSSGSLHVPFSLSLGYFVPQSSSLRKVELALHEWVGGLVYRIRAWRMSSHKAERQGSSG